ncbi:MAG: hypothetical protein ACK5T8_06300 [Alphaproteobacteria bacterium]
MRELIVAGSFFLLALAPSGAVNAQPVPAATQAQSDSAEIGDVIKRFDAAIRAQDLDALKSVFHANTISWRATGHPSSRAWIEKATKAPVAALEDQGAYQIIGAPEVKGSALAERFGPPMIVSDGQLATVTFRYAFTENGKVSNWGSESWQMIKGDSGWRIVNLLFSYNLQNVAPMPLDHLK